MYETKEFTGKAGTVKVLHTLGALPARQVVLSGLGPRGEVTPERMRQAAGAAAQALAGGKVTGAASALHQAAPGPGFLEASLEGFALGSYRYDCYKTKDREERTLEEVTALLAGDGRRQPDRPGGRRREERL